MKYFEMLSCCQRDIFKALCLGQLASVCLCGTAVFSTLLDEQHVYLPSAQSFLNYALLCLFFTVPLACCPEMLQGHYSCLLEIVCQDGWKYALLAFADVEANFLVVKAYSYTTVTSVQILDCFNIFIVMLFSWIVFRVRYEKIHIVGVFVSILGVGALIGADILTSKHDCQHSYGNRIVGDILVVAASLLYGISNVGQEFVVKSYSPVVFLGMIGLFGSLISGLQVMIFERTALGQLQLFKFAIWGPWLGFVACLFMLYIVMSLAVQSSTATTVNLSLLSADLYALLLGLILFHYKFHILYLMAFTCVLIGLAIYFSTPVGGSQTILSGQESQNTDNEYLPTCS